MWTQETGYISAERKRTTGQVIIRDESGQHVCTVDRKQGPLIAAAPQLLDCAKRIWANQSISGTVRLPVLLFQDLAAAIAKAEGKA